MKFKTNAKCGGCVASIRTSLQKVVDDSVWTIDLASPDKILTVTEDVPAEVIIHAVKSAGFRIEPIE